jgi:hypothetical protein
MTDVITPVKALAICCKIDGFNNPKYHSELKRKQHDEEMGQLG